MPPPQDQWQRLHYTIRGIKRLQAGSPRRARLPITANILVQLGRVWSSGSVLESYEARLMWAACCIGFFGFLRAGEFTSAGGSSPVLCLSDVAVDSHVAPSVLRLFLRRTKTDPFGRGVEVFMGKTGAPLCPISALLKFLEVRGNQEGPLFVLQDGSPLSRDYLVRRMRQALSLAGIEQGSYSGHSFRIGAATSAAAAGVPSHLIKALGRWSSEAYMVYIRTPQTTLAAVSAALAR